MGDEQIKIISGPVQVRLDTLHHQYKPKLTPLELYPGPDPMHVMKSHHVGLLKTIIAHGLDKKRLMKTPYWQERRHRYNIGMTAWTDSKVWEHIQHRWDTYKSLKKYGYDKKLGRRKPVIVLAKPIWETRFNWQSGFLNGPEDWDGMGRIAAAIMLGWETIEAVWAEDAMPGSCNGDKFLGKLKQHKEGL